MQNSRRAGKPAGKKPEKQGLLGLFTKGKNIPTTAQQTLPYREMYRDGVCRVADRYYTKTIEYEDINYQLAQSEDQAAIFDGWSACLNYFDSSLPFQLSFLNHRSRPGSRYSVNIPMQDDDYNSVRCEYVEMLENQIAKSNNGIVRTKLLTFGVNVDDLSTARARLERVEADICGNFKKLGVKCRSLSGLERLELLHGQLHPGSGSPFRFSWDMIPKTGLSTKDFIAPDSFDFRFSRLFRVGTTWGAASYLQILASELSDKLLAELLEMDAEMTITLHIQTVDQAAAVKSIKAKVSDIDKMKVEEQKKAARSGYDMDILPPDLVTYSNDAKTLLEDLQSRNERMFLLTFLVVNMAPTRRELDNDLFTVSGIVQKYNCTLKRLDFQQEDGFLSSLPLGHNGIEIKRGMTTSSTAIFVPFMTQELRMNGEAVYYGLNALSHNVIMANRKKLKNPNGLFLGVPGSGKSFAAKRELVNVFLATKDRIIVVDPMGEYSPLIRRLGGQVIEIAPDSPHHINPMDIDLSFDEENPMALKADFILSLMELIVGGKDGLQPVERTVIDRCVRQMYREHLQDPETSKMPTLQTLYDLLCSQPEGEAVRLATALEIYVSGSLNVFNHETNVDLNRRLVCLDLKKLGAGLRTIAMLIMQDLVNSQVSMNFLRGIATWCYFDEFHVLLRDRLTASYCVAIWKMLRKKGCVPSALTQNVKDFLASPEIENIFENSDFLVLLSQAQGDRQILAKQLGISPHHINPMDIDLSFDEENPMALKADFILSLMELIVGGKDGLQPVERTVIDRCVRQMYREHLQDPETSKMPTLQTLYDLLCSQPEGEAVRLATALEIYVSGSLNVFNHETNVDLNRRLVCLDLKKLGAGLRTIAMLIMQDLVNSQVSMNFLRGIATWCYFDEFHVLLRDRLTASYCVAIWKMLRKKGCVPSALTQNVKDFLASPEIENIFENSDFLVLLSQAQGDRQILAKQLGISPHQLSYVTHTNSGEGLLFFGNTTIPFVDRFPQNTELYAIMTTRPEDKKQEMNRA